ncbi:substrate-binding domain-containing protein [Salinigranum halophilum]|uniref:ABC transporter substrate-binding protein n=1 Tax=Salinigranum halophilum TaxID=2565931 RepID=UPI0010A8B0D5|nr:ABC transporter substrate-binding protein [Salinigranum halophilum]
MTRKRLAFACDLNVLTWPVYEGLVEPSGIDLNFLATNDVVDIFNRMIRHQEFECSEMSMSSYLMACDRDAPQFTAIPVFPSRVFRHGFIFVNADSGIEKPADLRGTDVGVPSYTMTAALWARGVLQHEYDVHSADVTWYQASPQGTAADDPLAFDYPEDVTVEQKPAGETLSDLLAAGELDALVSPKVPPSYDGEHVRRLFPNYRAVEAEYYDRTGHFPIMHTIVVRDDVLDESPWVASELTTLFDRAKEMMFEELRATSQRRLSIPWVAHTLEDVEARMGEDFWPYGVAENEDTLDAMTAFAYEQGFTSEKLAVDDLFAPNCY